MLNTRKHPSFLTQLCDVFLMQLSNWRWSWRAMIVTGMVTPLLSIIGLGILTRNAGLDTVSYIFTGNIVLSLMFENQNKVAGNFAYMRAMGTLQYFATLPIYRYTLIIATVLAFFLLSLPSLLVTIVFGTLFLGLTIKLNLLLLIVIPLSVIPLAGIGALIGAGARTPEEASSFSLLLTLIMVSLGPVILPTKQLPLIMLLLGRLSPATYAASALRQTLLGPLTGELFIDMAVLSGFAIVTLWLVARRMDWRQQ